MTPGKHGRSNKPCLMTDLCPIYVRMPNWIGDVCMALPSLQIVLGTGHPVVVCARPWAKALLSAYPIAGFIPMSGQWRADRRAVAAFKAANRHNTPLRPLGLLLPDSLSSALVFRLAGLPCAGYRDDGRSLFLKWPIKKPRPRPHAVASWYGLTRSALLGWQFSQPAEHPPANLGLKLRSQARLDAQHALAEAGLAGQSFVLIAPTATGLHKGKIKVWPHFDPLTRQLQGRGLTVIMCPPPSEREAALQNAPTAHCLPSVPLDVYVALTQLADLVICNDSGVSHLAAAGGALQLTLFGVTEHERTGPWSARAHCLGSMGAWPDLDTVVEKAISLLPS